MDTKIKTFLTLSLLLVAACDPAHPDESVDTFDDPRGAADLEGFELGKAWGPCDLTEFGTAVWWGCDGHPHGGGLACLRPVADAPLSICVPQTWDESVDHDCGNVEWPGFGLGVIEHTSTAYCVLDCETDDDCGPGRACSPASHICAWVED